MILHENVKKATDFLKENRKTILTLLAVFILADILFVKMSSDFVIFSVLLLYGIFIKIFQINKILTLLLCLALLILMSIGFLFTGVSVSTEKSAVWLILFLAVSAVQGWKE